MLATICALVIYVRTPLELLARASSMSPVRHSETHQILFTSFLQRVVAQKCLLQAALRQASGGGVIMPTTTNSSTVGAAANTTASDSTGSTPATNINPAGGSGGGNRKGEWEDPTLSNWKPTTGSQQQQAAQGSDQQLRGQGPAPPSREPVYETKWGMMSLPVPLGPASGEGPPFSKFDKQQLPKFPSVAW